MTSEPGSLSLFAHHSAMVLTLSVCHSKRKFERETSVEFERLVSLSIEIVQIKVDNSTWVKI